MFTIAEAFFVGGELGLAFMHGLIDAAVEVFAFVMSDKAVLMFGYDNDFGALLLGFRTVQDQFNTGNQVVEFGQFGSLFLGIFANCLGDFQMPAGNGYVHV